MSRIVYLHLMSFIAKIIRFERPLNGYIKITNLNKMQFTNETQNSEFRFISSSFLFEYQSRKCNLDISVILLLPVMLRCFLFRPAKIQI